MAKIRVDLENTIKSGQTLVFRAPIDFSDADGLIVYYPENGSLSSASFDFVSAGTSVDEIAFNAFLSEDIVNVLLDKEKNKAYILSVNVDEIFANVILSSEKGAPSGVATLDENGLVPGEQVNAVVPGGTLLWEGSWESGDLTVENADKFKLFQILMSGQGTTILAARTSQHIRGIGGYATAAPKIYTYHFSATVAENTWSLVSCNSMVHNPGSSHDEANGKIVTSIYGLC